MPNLTRLWYPAAAFGLSAVVAMTLPAQDTTTKRTPVVLDAQVISASGAESSLRDAPASVSVVTRKDLERRPVRDLADILGSVEGISIAKSGNLSGIQIRGLGSGYTMMLIDGKRINSQAAMFRGNDYDSGWIPAEAIERIEVVRGPMSSLYGSDAVGGVINIITRKVSKRWSGSLTGEATRQENRNAGDAYQTSFSVSGPLLSDVLGLKMFGSYNRRMGDGAVNPAPGTGSAQPGYPGQKNGFISGELAWKPNASNNVSLGLDYSSRNHGGFTMDRQAISAVHQGFWKYGTSELRASLDKIINHTGNITGEKHPNTATNTNVNGKFVYPWVQARQTITVGGETRTDRLNDPTNLSGWPGVEDGSNNRSTSVMQNALFLEDEIRVLSNLLLTLGNRYDHHENFGGHNSPRAYLVYHPIEAVTLKGGWAQAFKAPTLLQNSPNWGSVSCGSPTTGCYIIGSELLEPETGSSKEIGARVDFARWGIGVTWFHNDLRDMINITQRTRDTALAPTYSNFVGFLPDGRPIFRYENVSRARTRGAEVSARFEVTEAIGLRANYTNLDAKDLSGAKPVPLTYRPRHTANVNVDWQVIETVGLSVTSAFLGKQYISVPANGQNLLAQGGYNTIDVSAQYRPFHAIGIRGGVLNAGGKIVERETSSQFNEENRRFFLAVTSFF